MFDRNSLDFGNNFGIKKRTEDIDSRPFFVQYLERCYTIRKING
jgi:hypothetical protein